ncbi:DegT/DnrJ/EryC1/StrS aminotransferase family protein [Marinobacterium sp. LSUCC0821]|uniref:DegT/DnrJ/EryC1/StrS family aminotransferase n=1 Tax=Marinobacterium sp. LSUCC0821 TaxID=2668067 RepID=UPI0014515594|nr:DegT/DnrJ/EryC1/StrS family aminotransferase [Marinobacterium sp. LSUCC0821]QJD72175.1 DegT/DnrJ/EryC1/StrS family aminotransferase [Marinobacterium sp. LSUCC0821]
MLIPVYKPALLGNEEKYVLDCLREGWVSSRGKYVTKFESSFSDFLKLPAATSVSNGTVALHLALYSLGIGFGDEVIVPSLTYIASVNAIAYVGATPVFVDSLRDTWNLDPEDVKRKITPKTKAVMAVHLYGNPCAIRELQLLCSDNGLFLIEDAAEAFGSVYCGQSVGGFGDFSTFSFFGNKTITTGEGGMVSSKSAERVERAAFLKNQGVSLTREYWHDEVGFNFRMTNICAAIGLAQLERAESILQKKKLINDWYRARLEGVGLQFQYIEQEAISSYWMVTVLVASEELRNNLRVYLDSKGIETRPMFIPAHQMPAFYCEASFLVAEDLSVRGINLPSYPGLLETDVEVICEHIIYFITNFSTKC